jgi:hypothetical protein
VGIRRQAASQLKSHNANKAPDNNSKTYVLKTEISEKPLLKTTSLSASQSRIALALAGAESKGVELDHEGLQNYSAAIDPDANKERQSKDRKRPKRENADQAEQKNKIPPLTADKIKQIVLESTIDNTLLDMLNNLPDANGRRWIVLPFEYNDNGKTLKVSLRFFLEQDKKTVKQIALDITEAENRLVFIISNEKTFKLTLYIEPHLSETKLQSLENELSNSLNINRDLINVKNRATNFPYESGSEDNTTLSVNEAV